MTKKLPDSVQELRDLGYEVTEPQPSVPSYFIRGFGVATYVRKDDAEALESLADKKAHKEREKQMDGKK